MSARASRTGSTAGRRRGLSVLLALAGGLATIALVLAVTLSGAPLDVSASNGVAPEAIVAETKGHTSDCQSGEVLPAGTTAIRLWITGNIKPRVAARVLAGPQLLAAGVNGGGWLGKVVTVPIARVPRTIYGATVCYAIGPAVEAVDLLGEPGTHRKHASTPARLRIEYLRPGPRSWWSLSGAVARRIGIGRAPSGAWVALIPLALMAIAALLASWTLAWVLVVSTRGDAATTSGTRRDPPSPEGARFARRIAGRVPWPAMACACVAFLSAASWSILSPPFQVIDEPSHFAYAQILAETDALPREDSANFSLAEKTAMEDLEYQNIHFNPAIGTISSAAQQQELQRDLAAYLPGVGRGAGVASPQPPLYYALLAVPYELASGGTLLDQLEAMRLLSALLAALTAFFGYLFLREALPATPWAWIVGGLALALAPLLGYISGAVNPEAMLCTVCTALFYCLARAFRRGLTPPNAIAIGAVSAIGFLTKLNFIGLAPGILLALALLTYRARRGGEIRRTAYRSLALALVIAAAPVCIYTLVNVLSGHAGLGLASKGLKQTGHHHGSLLDELTYIWDSYLPHLPGTANDFRGVSALRQLWFDRSVGLYGWLDTHFPSWVYSVALVLAVPIGVLCVRGIYLSRTVLRERAAELLSYAAACLGLLLLIGADSYLEFPARAGTYSEPRYLLPMAALFAALLALAARGAGRRWGPALGTLIVLLILAQNIFAQLQVVARYYG